MQKSSYNNGGGIDNDGRSGNATLTVQNSTFTENTALFGGGIYSWGTDGFAAATIIGSTLSGNEAQPRSNGAGGAGGGILNCDGTFVVVDSTIDNNLAKGGGGIHTVSGYTDNAELLIVNSTISGNAARGSSLSVNGGGISNLQVSGRVSKVTVVNSAVVGNSAERWGGGVYNRGGQVNMTNTTVTGNLTGYTAAVTSEGYESSMVLNSVIVARNSGDRDFFITSGTLLSGSHNLLGSDYGQSAIVDGVDGNLVGTAESPIDPLFVRNPSDGGDGWGDDPDTPDIDESANDDYGDLRLRADSPAIDAGDNALLPADEFDLDGDGDTAEAIPYDLAGNPRVVGERVDIGAYEYVAAAAIPGDLNGDGTVSGADLDIVRANWGQPVVAGSLVDGDPSGDGAVNSADLDIIRANWGRTGPAAAGLPVASGTKSAAGYPVYGPVRRNESACVEEHTHDAVFAGRRALAEAAWMEAVEGLRGRTNQRQLTAVDLAFLSWED